MPRWLHPAGRAPADGRQSHYAPLRSNLRSGGCIGALFPNFQKAHRQVGGTNPTKLFETHHLTKFQGKTREEMRSKTRNGAGMASDSCPYMCKSSFSPVFPPFSK